MKRAWEILVELEGGAETLAIVQPADQNFSTGEKVRLYTRSDGAARVALGPDLPALRTDPVGDDGHGVVVDSVKVSVLPYAPVRSASSWR